MDFDFNLNEINPETTAVLGGGRVEYSMAEAAVSLDELARTIEQMRDEGVTHVVMSSGNHRGAKWASITTNWSWASEE